MSMMGCFRELTPPVLERLTNDPSLVEEVVLAPYGSQSPGSELQEHVAAAVEQMKARLAESGPELLGMMPQEQRQVLDALSPEQQKDVFKELAAQLAAQHGWDSMVERSGRAPRITEGDLGPLLEIDKAWHGVHYLLTGAADEAPGPLGQVVLGGSPLGEDTGYGPPRHLSPAEVATVSAALRAISRVDLKERYDSDAFTAADIYPGGWDDPESLTWLLDAFDRVERFYRAAAERESAVLLYLT